MPTSLPWSLLAPKVNLLESTMATVSWSQLVTVAVTTFVCTLTGLYLFTTHQPNKSKRRTKASEKSNPPQSKHHEFWDNYHDDASATSEWSVSSQQVNPLESHAHTHRLADWSELEPLILSQLRKLLNQHKHTDPLAPADVRILILGNGLSEMPIHLYRAGFTRITVTDISRTAIDAMRCKYPAAQYPSLTWCVADCTALVNHALFADNAFNVVFEKAVSDTLQFRRRSGQSEQLLQRMFAEVSRVLKDGCGRYLVVTPRRSVPLLKLARFGWSCKRMQVRGVQQHAQGQGQPKGQPRRPPFVYLHACTKVQEQHHMRVIKGQQSERRQRFERAADEAAAMRRLRLCFDPLVHIEDVDRDVTQPFAHFEDAAQRVEVNENRNAFQLENIVDEIAAFYVIHGVIQFKRKFGRKLIFYQVSVKADEGGGKTAVLV